MKLQVEKFLESIQPLLDNAEQAESGGMTITLSDHEFRDFQIAVKSLRLVDLLREERLQCAAPELLDIAQKYVHQLLTDKRMMPSDCLPDLQREIDRVENLLENIT